LDAIAEFFFVSLLRFSFCISLLTIASTAIAVDDEAAYFRERVEPILKQHCYSCHSHAAGNMENGLTLDWRSGWGNGGDRGPAITPGNADNSLLIQAVRHVDPDLKMPEEKLSDDEINVLVEWVNRGAIDPRTVQPEMDGGQSTAEWWSLKPLVRPAIPEGNYDSPIDAFVLNGLRTAGLEPSPEADHRTLIRRLVVDLHGLPPSWEEVEAFVKDSDPQSYERLLDQLLTSPRYGERWARHWFDTIHFADSHGYEHDVFRPNAWRYRDYTINSLNSDKPWDTFVREQLATDYLFPDAPQLTPALGFLGAGTYDHSAAATAPMAFEYLDRDDLVTQTMASLVSTTANCARCHAHKFDPITQEDYFSLQSVFAGIGKGDITFDADPGIAAARKRWKALSGVTDQQRDVLLAAENSKLVSDWEEEHHDVAVWQPLTTEAFLSADGAELTRLTDGSIVSGGSPPEMDTVSVVVSTNLEKLTAIRLDLIPDETLPAKGPGRAENGNLHLSEFELQVFSSEASQAKRIPIRRATADFDQAGWTVQHAIDGNPTTAWGIHPEIGKPHFAVFELETPQQFEPNTRLAVVLKQRHGRRHVIGRFKLSATDAPPEATIALPAEVQAVLAVKSSQRTIDQQCVISVFVLRTLAVNELALLPEPTTVYAAAPVAKNERGIITIAEPRDIRILKRGDIETPLGQATPGALTAIKELNARFDLADTKNEAARRAALADWIVDHRNPLTWRSIANRVWQYHFGKGICDTPNDFGRMGSLPSHPELLDWLACELRDSGGSLKHLHRLICLSSTYRQAANYREDIARIDPDNRLLARMNRQRLDADSYRDAVLQVSGRLDTAMFGSGIAHFSTSPGAQLTPILDYSHYDFDSMGATRRSIYRVVWRGIQDPFMEALDFPDLGLLVPTRSFSASPLQSLALLNNRFVLHHTQHLARRAESGSTEFASRVREIFQWTLLREPTTAESEMLVALAVEHGIEAVGRLLLNSNEFIFVE
jgi:Protein of unknown function (DUF1553)/Protein of unknown function (DUF1549)/Planctomycete cytochrome C